MSEGLKLDEKALAPCPFCGGEAEMDTDQAYRALRGGRLGSRVAIYCTKCNADMGFCYEDAPEVPHEAIVSEVVDAWNRRAALPPEQSAAQQPATEADLLLTSIVIGGEVRRRNRVGDDGERGSISSCCEGAATDLVLQALRECGYSIAPPLSQSPAKPAESEAEHLGTVAL